MKKAFFVVALLSAFNTHLQAQEVQKSKVSSKKQQAKQPDRKAPDYSAYDTAPFDVNLEALPANYRGHSCFEISRLLGSLKLVKDEFESSKAFADRIEFVKEGRLYGQLTGSSVLSFSPSKPMMMAKYDADTETMRVRVLSHGSGTARIDGNFYTSAPINKELSSSRNYVGENGYGKKVEINSFTYDVCGITFANVNSISRSVNIPSDFSFKISTEIARNSKESIGILYIATLSAPYVTRYSDYMKATMDSPTEISMSGPSIVTKLSQVWIYNTKTGQIFVKEAL